MHMCVKHVCIYILQSIYVYMHVLIHMYICVSIHTHIHTSHLRMSWRLGHFALKDLGVCFLTQG